MVATLFISKMRLITIMENPSSTVYSCDTGTGGVTSLLLLLSAQQQQHPIASCPCCPVVVSSV